MAKIFVSDSFGSSSEIVLSIVTSQGRSEVPLRIGEETVVDLEGVEYIAVEETSKIKNLVTKEVAHSERRPIAGFSNFFGKIVGFAKQLDRSGKEVITSLIKDAEGRGPAEKVATFKLEPTGTPGKHEFRFEFFTPQKNSAPIDPMVDATSVWERWATETQRIQPALLKEIQSLSVEGPSEETVTQIIKPSVLRDLRISSEDTVLMPPHKNGPAQRVAPVIKMTPAEKPFARPHLEIVGDATETILKKVPRPPIKGMTFGRFCATAGAYMSLGLAGFLIKKVYETFAVERKATALEKLGAYSAPFMGLFGVSLTLRGRAAVLPGGISLVSGLVGFMPIGIGVSVSESLLGIEPESLGGELGGLGVASALAAAASYAKVAGTSAAAAGLTATGVGVSALSGIAVGASAASGVAIGHYVIDLGIGSLINSDGDGTVSGLIAEQVYKDPWTLALAVWPGGVPVGPAVYGIHRLHEWVTEDVLKKRATNFSKVR